ncbi:ATP-binding protein [Paucibacter sp. R3-3]|uniref:histidine kinase n=1 Tax=Roseateles agri TaxID=3098619 RepID=A0ABU5DMX9_9BURK|nr:ATP-binding protein [Paucibacter sp. R3-3]MDY0747647.1 ATP-binding protein [Paucibacter sp. R3-3]
MAFDLIHFARELLGLSGHEELLGCARRAAESATQQPAFASHVLPGRLWQQACVLAPEGTSSPAAVRSALYAIHRRILLEPRPLQLRRDDENETIVRALLPEGSAIELLAVPLLNGSGRPTGALVVGRPSGPEGAEAQRVVETIAALAGPAVETAWRHTQARWDQERLRLFSETTEESLWDWNVAQNEVWWGGNLEQLFGGRARVSKRPDWRRQRIHVDDVERVVASFDAGLVGSASSWSAEYRVRGVEDAMIHVREHVYFLREVNGTAYRAIGTVRDVSALQLLLQREIRARATAEHTNSVKDEFLAMLGHELRNPLAPIVSVTTLLERMGGVPPRPLEILRRQTQHLVRLVDDLLDVSRISSGKVELAWERVAVQSLAQRAVEMVQPLLEQRRHRLELNVAPGLEIGADVSRMTQVLSNLLANAAKYTEPGGLLQLLAREEKGEAVFRIRDNGIGIAAEFLPTVFDMFTQSRQALDRAQGGLGLGLSIVKNIVKLHGGTVEAKSEGAGRGTEVIVRLPPADPASELASGTALPTHAATTPRRVMIVDDNEDAAASLEAVLVASGHVVRVAHHPEQALSMFAAEAPDVALIDIGLPAMDGYELVSRMRWHAGAPSTRFVALTGYGLAADKARASAAGFDAHAVKPVWPGRLEFLIEQLTAGRLANI